MNTSSMRYCHSILTYLHFTNVRIMIEHRQKDTYPLLSMDVLFEVDAIVEELAAETTGLSRGQISVSIPAMH